MLGGGWCRAQCCSSVASRGSGSRHWCSRLAAAMTASGRRVLIASAEESIDQVGLGRNASASPGGPLFLLAEDDIDRILSAADEMTPTSS